MTSRQNEVKKHNRMKWTLIAVGTLSILIIIVYLGITIGYSFDNMLSRLLIIGLGMSGICGFYFSIVRNKQWEKDKEIARHLYAELTDKFSDPDTTRALLKRACQERGLITVGDYERAESIRDRQSIEHLLHETWGISPLQQQKGMNVLQQRTDWYNTIGNRCGLFAVLSLFVLGHILLLFWPDGIHNIVVLVFSHENIGSHWYVELDAIIAIGVCILFSLMNIFFHSRREKEISLEDYKIITENSTIYPKAKDLVKQTLELNYILDEKVMNRLNLLIGYEMQSEAAQSACARLTSNCLMLKGGSDNK